MKKYPNAVAGLKLVLLGELAGIVGSVLGLIHVLDLVAAIIILLGGIAILLGLFKASADDEGYRTALMLSLANIVIAFVGNVLKSHTASVVLGIVATVIQLGVIFFVCNTTSNLLHSANQEAVSKLGTLIWKVNVLCVVAAVIINVLSVIPVLRLLAIPLSILLVVVQLVADAAYILFLYQATNA